MRAIVRTALLIGLASAGLPRAWAQSLAPVGGEFQVSTHTARDQSKPAVGADDTGRFVVVWLESIARPIGVGDVIVARRFEPHGTPVGTEIEIAPFFSGTAPFTPDVALDGAGGFVVTWEAGGSSPTGVFAKRVDASGQVVGAEFLVNIFSGSYQGFAVPRIAGNGEQFVVSWSRSGSHSGVVARRLNAEGLPEGDELQVDTLGFDADVALANDRTFAVVWSSSKQGGGLGVFGRRFDLAGQALASEFQLNAYTPGDQFHPRVAIAPAGELVVVWTSVDRYEPSQGLFGQRLDATGGSVGPDFPVNSGALDSRYAAAALDVATDGSFLVVWEGFSGMSGGDVIGRGFTSSGRAVGPDFVVNRFTEYFQGFPVVAAAADREFVVVWASLGQNGLRLFSIFGQRLDAGAGQAAPPIPTVSRWGLLAMVVVLASAAAWIARIGRRG